jgi:hypothetical protein
MGRTGSAESLGSEGYRLRWLVVRHPAAASRELAGASNLLAPGWFDIVRGAALGPGGVIDAGLSGDPSGL